MPNSFFFFFIIISTLSLSPSLSKKMDLVAPTEHLCYVRCTYCNTVLAVGVPCKRLMDTVTVKCGHCNNLSFLSPRPSMVQSLLPSDPTVDFQGSCTDCRKNQPLLPPSPSLNEQTSPKAPFVVKPPEKKHRLPSAYNRFMREEIRRIKAAKPDIPHREAFSMAAKNWAKCDPRSSSSSDNNVAQRPLPLPAEKGNGQRIEGFVDVFKQMERKI